jgi:hypothetical protein
MTGHFGSAWGHWNAVHGWGRPLFEAFFGILNGRKMEDGANIPSMIFLLQIFYKS